MIATAPLQDGPRGKSTATMSDPSFAIDTPRLRISYLQPDDDAHCDFLVELYNTPEFIAAEGGRPTPVTDREKARERLTGRVRHEHERNGYGTYLVSLKSDDAAGDVPIGTVSLMRGEGPDSLTVPDLGFAFLPAHMRKGYATEAARALLEYAERDRGVEAVLGLHDPGNEASRGVFRKLGFEDRGKRVLKMFGGVVGQVWTKPGMADDLGVYGL